MKQIFYVFISALILSSCSQEEFVSSSESISENSIVYANLPVQSRITLDGFQPVWHKGNKFAVFNANNERNHKNAYYEVNTADDGKTSAAFHFGGKDNNEPIVQDPNFVPQYAVYSYYLYPSVEGNTYKIRLPQYKNPSKNLTLADAPMFGVFDGNVVTFKYITALLKIDLTSLPDEKFNSYKGLKIRTQDVKLDGNTSLDENHHVLQIKDKGTWYLDIDKSYCSNKVYYLPLAEGIYPELVIYGTVEETGKTETLGNFQNVKFTCGEMITFKK